MSSQVCLSMIFSAFFPKTYLLTFPSSCFESALHRYLRSAVWSKGSLKALHSECLAQCTRYITLYLFDIAGSSRFLQPEQNVLNHLVTELWLTAPSHFTQQIFGCFRDVMAPVHELDNVTRGVKQNKTLQRTYYHDTNNHNLNCFGHVIYALWTSMYYQNIAKLLTHIGHSQNF